MMDWGDDAAPPRWILCQGQAISRATYAGVFAVYDTKYGAGDGSTTFNLPNYKGKTSAGADEGAGILTGATLGAVLGAQAITLTEAQMPVHGHTLTMNAVPNHTHGYTRYGSANGWSWDDGGGAAYTDLNRSSTGDTTGGGGAHTPTGTVGNNGGGASHSNVQPTLVANKIMYTGVL
jgi:microcystin-dependent protein